MVGGGDKKAEKAAAKEAEKGGKAALAKEMTFQTIAELDRGR